MSNILNQTISKLGDEMAKRYPKGWKKTAREIDAAWREVDAAASGIVMNPGNLATLNIRISNLKLLSKVLQRAQVADALDSVK